MNDLSDEYAAFLNANATVVADRTGLINEFRGAYDEHLRKLDGTTSLFVLKMDRSDTLLLVLVITDWDGAAAFEDVLEERAKMLLPVTPFRRGTGVFKGHQVVVIRDECHELVGGE